MTTTPRDAAHDSKQERTFLVEELFFSTTDTRGFIRAGNEVFVRVSAYSAEELLGKPHNIIRHPDMPRVVFRLLWDTIERGEPIVAYVKNRAKDGAHYWVLASVRPVPGGYLSVRLKPTSPLFATVRGVYEELRQIEAAIEEGGGTRHEAMDASGARLAEILANIGFDDYTSFMRTVLATEVLSRRAALGNRARAQRGQHHSAATELAARLGRRLNAELDSIAGYLRVNEALADRSTALMHLAEEGQLLALNAVLASRRLGADGRPLVAVAHLMQQTLPEVMTRSRTVVERIASTRAALERLGFEVALAVLQNDVATTFLHECLRGSDHSDADSLDLLIDCLRGDICEVLDTIHVIASGLEEVVDVATDLENNLSLLEAIERNGRIEAARTVGADAFRSLLDNTRERVDHAKDEVRQVASLAGVLDLSHATRLAEALRTDLEQLHDAVAELELMSDAA